MEWNAESIIDFKAFHHQESAVPQSILSADLRIIWHNRAFQELFRLEEEVCDEHIGRFAAFSGSDQRSLFHQLNDPDTGYSFSGRGESQFQHHSKLYTDVLIIPLLSKDQEEAIGGYCAYFHDVSADYKQNLKAIFSGLLQASLMKDNDTGQHIERVNQYSALMAEELYRSGTILEVNLDFVENISFLAAMHDVGKIGIPDDLLNKEGPLEDWEWEIMKTHTLNGAYILASYPDSMAVEIARSHHERWDGSGYPYGLLGSMIPLSARIVTIADVYDALRTKRSYKDEMSHAQAKELILLGKETQFDPDLVELFKDLEPDFERIYAEMVDRPSSRTQTLPTELD